MPRNVRLPNGVVIKNVPDDVTKEQVRDKAIQTGRASPEDFQQAPQQRQSAAPPPSARRQTQQDVAMERAANINTLPGPPPAQLANRDTQGVFERARDSALEAGVNPRNSAPTKARIALALAAPVAQDPQQQAGVLENALGEDYEVRVGPDTNEVEWKPSGEEQWSLANPPGFDLRDLAAAGPETGTLAAGVAGGTGGLGGGAAVSGGNPAVTGTTTVLGVGAGEGAATKVRLELAREKGYLPEITDQEINDAATRRAIEGVVFTALGGVVTKGARMMLARQLGASPDLIRALGDVDDVEEAFKRAEDLKARTKAETGEEMPMTAGQAADSPEMRVAESSARRSGPADSELMRIERQQQEVQGQLERRAFGDGISPEESDLLSETFRLQADKDVETLRRSLEEAVDPVAGRAASTPEEAAKVARGQIELGIRDLYENNFSPRYTAALGDADTTQVSLAPLRNEARDIQQEFGQGILKSISLTDEKIFREAKEAGLELEERLTLGPSNLLEWEKGFKDKETSLSQVQNALVDIRRELRRPGISEEPKKAKVLNRLETRLETIRNNALAPEQRAEIIELDRKYAQASRTYDESFVGNFIELAPDGTPKVRTNLSYQRLLRSPETADQFVESVSNLSNGEAALAQFRRGTVSYILEQARDADGNISEAALNKFLTEPNRRALSSLFQGDDIAEEFKGVKSAAKALRKREQQVERSTQYVNDLLNARVTNAQEIGELTYQNLPDLTVKEVTGARNFLPESERGLFDRAVATEIRNQVVDSQGRADPRKIDKFLEGRESLVAKELFGESYLSTLRTLRDVADIRQPVTRETAGRDINGQIAQIFETSAGFADGMMRFMRVPFPPLSVRGRALTASLSQLQSRTQRQLSEVLADPERFNDLRRLLSTDIKSSNFEKIAAGAGLSSFVELKDAVEEAQRLSNQKEQDRQELGPSRVSPTL